MDYILGVDGGNTKTDYFLFDVEGNFIGMHRDGTCSHEALADSFEGTRRVMRDALDYFLNRRKVRIEDIKAACFGLAGDDIPSQQRSLEEIIASFGFKNFIVVNDSTLGIKAGTTKGYGVCSINGTGTSASGIDKNGKVLQIGGIGEVTGDEGGGKFISRKVVRAVYDEAFRLGPKTSLTKIVFDGLGIDDKYMLTQVISKKFKKSWFDYNKFTIACFEEANKGDEASIKILEDMGKCLARAAAGAIVELGINDTPEVVLAGSVYVKGSCPILVDTFKAEVNRLTGQECMFNVLQVPPATGAIIWAKELYDKKFPSYEERQEIVAKVVAAMNK